jgi:hypothetical protein
MFPTPSIDRTRLPGTRRPVTVSTVLAHSRASRDAMRASAVAARRTVGITERRCASVRTARKPASPRSQVTFLLATVVGGGEMSLLDGEPRSATVVAATDVRLLVVDRPHFWRLLEEIPDLPRRILTILSVGCGVWSRRCKQSSGRPTRGSPARVGQMRRSRSQASRD